MMPALLNASGECLFIATGATKASVLERVLHSAGPTGDLPATLITGGQERVRWLVDASAASGLERSRSDPNR